MAVTIPKALEWVDKQLGRLTGLFAIVGALGIFALMCIILLGVFWRYWLNNPIFGIGDVSVLVLSVIAAASVIYGARAEAHVSVNIIKMFVGRKVTRVTDLVMRCVSLLAIGIATYALFSKACGFEKACITENLSVEHWPFYYVLCAAMALYFLHVLLQLIQGVLHWSGDDPNEVAD